MGRQSKGTLILNLGEKWREQYVKGIPIDVIALREKQNRQVVSRSIWLAKIPDDLKILIRLHPEIFTRVILVDKFAGKRRQCEKNGFSLLRSEIERLIASGAGTKPKLKKTNKKYKIKNLKTTKLKKDNNTDEPVVDPTYDLNATIEAEYRIKQALGYACRVAFDTSGGGEVRIFFKDKKALEGLIEMFEPFSKNLF